MVASLKRPVCCQVVAAHQEAIVTHEVVSLYLMNESITHQLVIITQQPATTTHQPVTIASQVATASARLISHDLQKPCMRLMARSLLRYVLSGPSMRMKDWSTTTYSRMRCAPVKVV